MFDPQLITSLLLAIMWVAAACFLIDMRRAANGRSSPTANARLMQTEAVREDADQSIQGRRVGVYRD